METKKPRSKKTSSEQMEAIIEYFKTNKILLTGKCHPNATQEVEKKWDELTVILNNIPSGARKDKKQWKCFFSEWKSKTKKKARLHKKNLVVTGGGGYICSDLTDLENRLMRLIGWISVLGCDEVPEEIDPSAPVPLTEIVSASSQEGPVEDGQYEIGGDGLARYIYESEEEPELLEPLRVYSEFPEPVHVQPESPESVHVQATPATTITAKDAVNCRTKSKAVSFRLKKNKRVEQRPKQSQLEKSAEMYAESAAVMARSVDNMASSISELAQAITTIAQAMVQIKIGETNK